MRKLLNNELNRPSVEEFKKIEKIPLIVVLDNVRSQHNIGAVFRTSDAFLIEGVYLCGITATPPNAEIHKSALGAETTVNWKYFQNTLDAIDELAQNGYTLVSIEQADKAIELSDFEILKEKKYAFIFGNEVKGVLQEVVDKCNYCVEIAQFGTKHSLNISITAGIVIWEFFNKFKRQ